MRACAGNATGPHAHEDERAGASRKWKGMSVPFTTMRVFVQYRRSLPCSCVGEACLEPSFALPCASCASLLALRHCTRQAGAHASHLLHRLVRIAPRCLLPLPAKLLVMHQSRTHVVNPCLQVEPIQSHLSDRIVEANGPPGPQESDLLRHTNTANLSGASNAVSAVHKTNLQTSLKELIFWSIKYSSLN